MENWAIFSIVCSRETFMYLAIQWNIDNVSILSINLVIRMFYLVAIDNMEKKNWSQFSRACYLDVQYYHNKLIIEKIIHLNKTNVSGKILPRHFLSKIW